MKVIFLDIDGVMNNCYCKISDKHENLAFDKNSVNLLLNLIKKTNAKLVISSSWRENETIDTLNNRVLSHYGLDKYVVGFTPVLEETIRGIEIQSYLKNNPTITKFIILDDDADMGDVLPHLIRTKKNKGFLKEHYDIAIQKLM